MIKKLLVAGLLLALIAPIQALKATQPGRAKDFDINNAVSAIIKACEPTSLEFAPSIFNIARRKLDKSGACITEETLGLNYHADGVLKYVTKTDSSLAKSTNNLASNEEKKAGHRAPRLIDVLCLRSCKIGKNKLRNKNNPAIIADLKTDYLQFMMPCLASESGSEVKRALFDVVVEDERALTKKMNFKTPCISHRVVYLDEKSITNKFQKKLSGINLDEKDASLSSDEVLLVRQELNATMQEFLSLPQNITAEEIAEIQFCNKPLCLDGQLNKLGWFIKDGRTFLAIKTTSGGHHSAMKVFDNAYDQLKANDILALEPEKLTTDSISKLSESIALLSSKKNNSKTKNEPTEYDQIAQKLVIKKPDARRSKIIKLFQDTASSIKNSDYTYLYLIPSEYLPQEILTVKLDKLVHFVKTAWLKACPSKKSIKKNEFFLEFQEDKLSDANSDQEEMIV